MGDFGIVNEDRLREEERVLDEDVLIERVIVNDVVVVVDWLVSVEVDGVGGIGVEVMERRVGRGRKLFGNVVYVFLFQYQDMRMKHYVIMRRLIIQVQTCVQLTVLTLQQFMHHSMFSPILLEVSLKCQFLLHIVQYPTPFKHSWLETPFIDKLILEYQSALPTWVDDLRLTRFRVLPLYSPLINQSVVQINRVNILFIIFLLLLYLIIVLELDSLINVID